MASDPKERVLTLPYPGGSLTANRGVLEALFGPELTNYRLNSAVTVTRKAHSRRRVIGGPAESVSGTTYQFGKYVSSMFNGARGGQRILVSVDGEWWSARMRGSADDLAAFLDGATWASGATVQFRSQKGRVYGPFKGA